MEDDKRSFLGQHFLIDFNTISKIIESCSVSKTDIVLELGTGYGYLTKEISKLAKVVLSYEMDKKLYSNAKSYLGSEKNVKIFNEDFFAQNHFDFDFFISNIPYSRSKDIMKWLSLHEFREAVIMVQKEFSEKLIASPGDTKYSVVSVVSQHCFDIEHLFHVGKDSFLPPPKIGSSVMRLRRKKKKMTNDIIMRLECLFSQRNKKLSSIRDGSPNSDNRIDELDAETLVEISKELMIINDLD